MTEAEHIAWDAHQQAIAGEIAHLVDLLGKLPDAHHYTATRNRLLMAMDSLDTAQDQIAAARARMPVRDAAYFAEHREAVLERMIEREG